MLAVAAKGRLPLPNSYRTILTRHAGLNERISFAAIAALAGCAPEDAPLQKLASSYAEYSKWANDVLVSGRLHCCTMSCNAMVYRMRWLQALRVTAGAHNWNADRI